MSHRDLVLAQGNAGSYALLAVAFVVFVIGTCWFGLHAGPYLLTVWRRGRRYRRRLRAARHRRSNLTHLAFRKAPLR